MRNKKKCSAKLITNMASFQLSESEAQLLYKGLKCVPTCTTLPDTHSALNKYMRRMSLGFHFRNTTSIKPALHKHLDSTTTKNINLLKYFSHITKDIHCSHLFALPFESPNLTEVQIS